MRINSLESVRIGPSRKARRDFKEVKKKIKHYLEGRTKNFSEVHGNLKERMDDLRSELSTIQHRAEEMKRIGEGALKAIAVGMASTGLSEFVPDLNAPAEDEWNVLHSDERYM
ncbi:hypothetical protein E1B28_004233 [Marasmius oreades]|uniref:Uncharacterized protein n=1 Tax=Marasmius oreades TaxID=181124 RepID=A0A9P8ACR8_9AGAR|nr:uncharacterized protein E1B28_004233 [Marasmius oreades]KAG7096824.1 hypothetical protein E1B28_004233 [Marasmius oreades]